MNSCQMSFHNIGYSNTCHHCRPICAEAIDVVLRYLFFYDDSFHSLCNCRCSAIWYGYQVQKMAEEMSLFVCVPKKYELIINMNYMIYFYIQGLCNII